MADFMSIFSCFLFCIISSFNGTYIEYPEEEMFFNKNTIQEIQGYSKGAGGPDDLVIGTKRLAVSKTPYDAMWSKLSVRDLKSVNANLINKIKIKNKAENNIKNVNIWVNNNIKYVSDEINYKKGDYWASASETLAKMSGDCEDFAILKMQILKEMGVDPGDMMLVVAYDKVRRMDHVLLLVRQGDSLLILDNVTDRLMDGHAANDYRPIISLSAAGKWLHGY